MDEYKGDLVPLYVSTLIISKTITMETVTVELSWEEYKTMMSALEAIKQMVDSQKLDELYVKLYMKRKIEKGK